MIFTMLNTNAYFASSFGLSKFAAVPSLEKSNLTELQPVYIRAKGALRDKVLLSEFVTCGTVEEIEDLLETGVGSINFKCTYLGKVLTVDVFNTGAVKVCCGVPKTIATDTELMEFVTSAYRTLSEWLSTTLKTQPKIACVNGMERLPKMTDVQLDTLIEERKSNFVKVMKPEQEKRGRRGGYKLYVKQLPRKLQVTIDKGGAAQVFGARTMEEVEESIKKLIG